MKYEVTPKAVSAAGIALVAAFVLSGCVQGPDAGPTPSVSDTQETESKEAPPAERSHGEDLAALEFEVSWLDAVLIAQEAFPGELVSLELERERTGFTYSVELVSTTEEFDVIIDADSGEVLRHETESLDAEDVTESRDEIFETSGLVDPSEAMKVALNEVEGSVHSWELEREDGGIFYEIEIDAAAGQSVEVTVDAETGLVTDIDD